MDTLFEGQAHNWLYLIITLGIYIWFFGPREDRLFRFDSFSDSFINTWGVIFLVVAFLAWYGGSAESLEAMIKRGYKWNALAQQFGVGLGVLLISLILSYVFIPIKNLFLKLHKYVNKENK